MAARAFLLFAIKHIQLKKRRFLRFHSNKEYFPAHPLNRGWNCENGGVGRTSTRPNRRLMTGNTLEIYICTILWTRLYFIWQPTPITDWWMDTNPLFESWDNCAYYPHTDSNSDSFDTVGREPFCSFESFWNGQEITKNISDNCKINYDIFRGKGIIKRENCKHLKGRESVWELNMNCHFSSLCEWKRKERGWKDWKVWKRKRDSKYHLSPTSELGSSSKVGTAVQSPVSFKVEQRWPQVEFCRALVKVVADAVQSRLL